MLAADQRSPTVARRFVANVLEESLGPPAAGGSAAPELVDDALLLTTELVTNAVVHAGTVLTLGVNVRVGEPAGGGGRGATISVTDRLQGPLPPSVEGDMT